MDNENNTPLPGGETLNDRLRRAAAMARQRTAVPGVDPGAAPEEAPEAPARSEASGPQCALQDASHKRWSPHT